MFIYQKNESQKERLSKLYRKVKFIYGNVPPQMELLGNIEADYLEDFVKAVLRIAKHPHINPDLFGFIRLFIAYREGYDYCKAYNTEFLLSKEYTQEQLDNCILDISNIPFDSNHQVLASHAIKAIYNSKAISSEDFELLNSMGWNQRDIFDAIEHAGTIFRNGRILTAYTRR